jgi:glycosyltransferase involved in cell wall biosynthesis
VARGSRETGPPRVSVLLPVLDAEETLEACLRSVARQVEHDWECVLVDDGSRDASLDRATRFAERDARVRLFPAPHRGLVAALGFGLVQCRGRYVARMDADDLMHRRRLADQADLLDANPAWAGAGCHVRAFPRSALGPGDRAYERWINGIRSPEDVEREAFVECPLVHPTWMFRREVLLEHGYEDRPWPEDYDLILRLITSGVSVGVLPRRRLCWRHGADRLSRRSPLYEPLRFTECKALHLARSFLARTERYILWGYGGTGRALCRALLEQGKRPSHIVELHAGRLGNRIHGAPVIPRESLREIPCLPLVVSVAREGPRNEIRRALEAMGFVEMLDFVCAA